MKNKRNQELKYKGLFLALLLILLVLLITLFFIRRFSEIYLDDVSPEISCEDKLFEKADVLWVIPKFNNKSISKNKTWCKQILSLDRKLGMHGVYHTYREFSKERTIEYINEGERIFNECFGFTPTEFKPPQLYISDKNAELIRENYKLITIFGQIFHKSYHCNDTGLLPNRVIDLI